MPSSFNSKSNTPSVEDLQKQVDELQKQIQQTQALANPILFKQEKEEIFYKWSAPERIFVKKDKQWYWTAALVVLIITVVLLIFGEAILVGAVFALLFVLYVINSVPPPVVDHSITSFGIRTAQQLYKWEDIENFWFSFKLNKEVLNLDLKLVSTKRLIFFFTKRDKPKIIEALKERIPYKEPPQKQGWVGKNADGDYIPLEDIEASIQLDSQFDKAS